MKQIAVIGGGISGLASAYYIKKMAQKKNIDVSITVIERMPQLGGTIHTIKKNDFIVEGGPDCFLTEKPWAAQLARELGIGGFIQNTNDENKGTFILRNNKLHALPDGVMLMVPTRILPMLTSSLLGIGGKLRMGLDLIVPRRKDGVEETLAEFVTRRLGKQALDRIAEPLVAGVHAGIPEKMSLQASFPRFKKLEDEYGSLIRGMIAKMGERDKMIGAGKGPKPTMFSTFKGGLNDLVSKLEAELSNCEMILGIGVTEMHPKTNGGWIISLLEGKFIEADAVILATPSYVTADLLHSADEILAEDLRGIPYISTVTVSMAFPAKELPWKKMKGFGFVVPRTEKRMIMAATWSSRKFFNRAPEDYALLRCFLGGAYKPEMVNFDDDPLIEHCLTELKEIVGLDTRPFKSWVFKWPYSMPQMIVGHEDRMRRVEKRVAALRNVEITGGAYYGLGIPDCIHQGQLAAERLITTISK